MLTLGNSGGQISHTAANTRTALLPTHLVACYLTRGHLGDDISHSFSCQHPTGGSDCNRNTSPAGCCRQWLGGSTCDISHENAAENTKNCAPTFPTFFAVNTRGPALPYFPHNCQHPPDCWGDDRPRKPTRPLRTPQDNTNGAAGCGIDMSQLDANTSQPPRP